MSVVGLTFGSGANAIRPSAASAASVATSASTRAVGCDRSYHAKPATRARPSTTSEAASQLTARPPRARRREPRDSRRSDARRRPPAAARSPPRMRAVWVAKYQPPPRTSAVGASATGAPSPSRTVRSAQAAENSASWVATSTAAPAAASARSRSASSSLWPRSMPRVGSSSRTAAGRLALQHDRQREPLALAAGEVARVAVGERAEPGRLERRGRKLLPHALGDQVVAGVLEQQRDPPGAHDAPARRLGEPGREPQQRRLARPVAPHQRHALPRRQRHVHPAQHRGAARDLVPDPLEGERAAPGPSGGAGGRSGRSAAPGAARPRPRTPASPRARSAARASLTATGGGVEAGEAEEAGARRLERVRAPARGSRAGRRRS